MSRPEHVPTKEGRRQVEAMAAYGIPQPDIARVIGISKPTLTKYYAEEIETAAAKANAKVAQSLFKKATGDGTASVTAAIFWLKTRAGWREVNVTEHSGVDGKPIETSTVIDLAGLSIEQLRALAAIRLKEGPQ